MLLERGKMSISTSSKIGDDDCEEVDVGHGVELLNCVKNSSSLFVVFFLRIRM